MSDDAPEGVPEASDEGSVEGADEGSEDGSAEARGGPDDERTVTVGSDGFQPDTDEGATDDAEPSGADEGATDAEGGARTTAGVEDAVPAPEGEFDWRGWLLVGVVVVSFLLLPAVVTLRPVRIGGFVTTYLVLPLVPAVLLGATAVWVAVRSRQG